MAKKNKANESHKTEPFEIFDGGIYYCTVFSVSEARAALNEARNRRNHRAHASLKGETILTLEPLSKEDDDGDDTWSGF